MSASKRPSSSSKEGSKKPSSSGKDKGSSDAGVDQSQPIYSKSHDEQVDLLAQALLREYMHKKGYKESLASFDEECPRNADTVSSRKVMGDLMLLSAEKQKSIKEQGLETIMEMLCMDRVTKKDQMSRMGELQKELQTELPPLFVAPQIPEGGKKAKKEKGEKKKKKKNKEDGEVGAEGEGKTKKKNKKKDSAEGSEKPAKGKKKAEKAAFSIDDLLDKEIPATNSSAPSSNQEYSSLKKNSSAGEKKRAKITWDDEPSSAAATAKEAKKNDLKSSAARAYGDDDVDDSDASSSSSSSSSSDGGGGSDSSDEDDYTSSLKRLSAEKEKEASAKSLHQLKKEGGRAVASWDIDDTSSKAKGDTKKTGGTGATPVAASSVSSNKASAAMSAPSHPSPLGESQAGALLTALVGGGAQGAYRKVPNSFMRQGFHFNSEGQCEALRYGLLQNEGGPCGVLAGVQAFLLQSFITNHFIVTADVQRSFLARAVAECLLMAQPDLSKITVVTVAPNASPSVWPTSSTMTEQRAFLAGHVGRGSPLGGFKNRAALEELLMSLFVNVDEDTGAGAASSAADWCSLRGYGLLCFILSLLLSRGIEVVMRDMDVEQPLIVEHGYCSQEITNLVLTGAATSNVHDGVMRTDGVELKGFLKNPMTVGFLSFLETKGLLRVGSRAKVPSSPIWVIYHESHYTCLFMKKDVRKKVEKEYDTAGKSSFDIFFYDQQGGQDEEIRLTVTADVTPLPAQRKDALVPYLNVIIRTVEHWENARVNWNGTDPLL